MMLPLTLAALLAVDAAKPTPPKIAEPGETTLEGIYRSVSKEGDKSIVTAATIRKAGSIYIVQWSTGTVGIGIRTSAGFSVGWTMETESGKMFRGVTVYAIKGRTLRGHWATLPGPGRVHDETMTWLGDIEEP